MLVVTRKTDETIYIGDNIKITIVGAGTDKVSIGIDAPRDITVLRGELRDTIKENEIAAIKVSASGMSNLAAILKKK